MPDSLKLKRAAKAAPYIAPPVQRAVRLIRHIAEGHPVLNKMGVPLTVDFAKTPENRRVMELVYSQEIFGRPYMLPPGVPAERVAELRDAFTAANKSMKSFSCAGPIDPAYIPPTSAWWARDAA